MIDEFAKNRISKNLIGAENEIKRIELPEYYNNQIRDDEIDNIDQYSNTNNDEESPSTQEQLQNFFENDETFCPTTGNDCTIDQKCGQKPVHLLKKSFPRKFTQAQLYTINEIKIFNNKKLNQKYIAPITTDIFAKIPIKTTNSQSNNNFEDIIEVTNSSNIFNTERVYNGPISIKRLNVKLIDDKGNIMNFYQSDWSFSLIAKQLYQF